MNIFVTGGSGFLGNSLVLSLITKGYKVRASTRIKQKPVSEKIEYFSIDGIHADTKWKSGLEGMNAVIHCAARAHIMKDNCDDPLAEFRKINTAGTLKLAEEAANCGIKKIHLY